MCGVWSTPLLVDRRQSNDQSRHDVFAGDLNTCTESTPLGTSRAAPEAAAPSCRAPVRRPTRDWGR
jgi:hypothetical protein